LENAYLLANIELVGLMPSGFEPCNVVGFYWLVYLMLKDG